MDKREEIIEILEKSEKIPSFPAIAHKLVSLVKDPESSTHQIVDVISFDPSIAGRVLGVANTMAFNTSTQKISSIEEAVIRVGFRKLSDIAISLAVIRAFSSEQGGIDYDRFWLHSLSTAYACQVIKDYASLVFKRPDDLYISGLIHDIGILIMDQFAHEYYKEVITRMPESEYPLERVEDELLGINSCEVGSILAKKWQLPQAVSDAIRFQNRPYVTTPFSDQATKILHIANFSCENQGLGNGLEVFIEDFSRSAWDELGLSIDDVPRIIERVEAQSAQAREIFNASSGLVT